ASLLGGFRCLGLVSGCLFRRNLGRFGGGVLCLVVTGGDEVGGDEAALTATVDRRPAHALDPGLETGDLQCLTGEDRGDLVALGRGRVATLDVVVRNTKIDRLLPGNDRNRYLG